MDDPGARHAEDAYHLRLLGVFHYILGGISTAYLIYNFTVGALIQRKAEEMQASVPNSTPNSFPMQAFQHLGDDINFFMTVWGFASLILNPLAGFCLQKTRGRGFLLAVSAFNCLDLPLGTVLAVFTILVLMRESVRTRFAHPSASYS